MSNPRKSAWSRTWRFAPLPLFVLVSSQTLGGALSPSLPDIYLPRFTFQCSRDLDLQACTAADLQKVGWSNQDQAADDLAEFTNVVLSEAQKQEPRVKIIKAAPKKALETRERELVKAWRQQGAREPSRPWIIQVQIKVKDGDCYSFQLQAKRAGQDDVLFPQPYKAHWGRFPDVEGKIYPKIAELLSQVGRDILGVGQSDEH